MLNRTRRKRDHNIGRGFALLLAFALVSLVVGYLAFISGVEAERGQKYADAYAQSAKEDAKRACIGKESSLAFDCVYERVEASQDQANARQELEAQQGMLFWAAVMAFVAIASVILTAAALWYIRGTLLETEKIARDSRRTAKASQDATRAMVEANQISQEAHRPWLGISAEIFHIGKLKNQVVTISLNVKVKNYSQYPVRNVRVAAHGHFWIGGYKGTTSIDDDKSFLDYFLSESTNFGGQSVFPQDEIVILTHASLMDPDGLLIQNPLCTVTIMARYEHSAGVGETISSFLMFLPKQGPKLPKADIAEGWVKPNVVLTPMPNGTTAA